MSIKAPARPRPRTTQTATPNKRNFLWIGVSVAVLLFAVVAVIIWRQTSFPFSFVGGEEQAVVLLRNP
ncbi:MAG: hypothetical protein L0Y74_05650, partial [candidate division Zixibacteria bacterium]|nr:hypothetical protein [candidate division Zixibacteria bacterium]